MINSKTLALLAAAVIGTSLAACNRGGGDKSASNQDSSPMNQAPKQGYTGPATPSTSPPSSSDNQTGSPGSTNPSSSQPQPGSTEQNQQNPSQQR